MSDNMHLYMYMCQTLSSKYIHEKYNYSIQQLNISGSDIIQMDLNIQCLFCWTISDTCTSHGSDIFQMELNVHEYVEVMCRILSSKLSIYV